MSILDKLRGGDLRSIGRSNEVAEDIEKNDSLFETVFRGLYDKVTGSPAIQVRGRKLLKRLNEKGE